MSNPLTFYAEAAPDGVNIMYRSNDGMTERVGAVSYIDAVDRLDTGDYDDRPDGGMPIYLAIVDDGNQGYSDYTSQHSVIMWRWLIVTVLTLEVREENGTVSIIDDTGNPPEAAIYSNGIIVTPLYSTAERLAMANNTESATIERFGIKPDTKRAIIFYRITMGVGRGALTPLGRETLAELHNSSIAKLNENGVPAEPVTH